jgi:2-oxoglutarate ferredoxin oxidoreductase subunit beta
VREAIAYPGFAFVHVLAGCITYQPDGYADDLYQRCFLVSETHRGDDLAAATDLVRQDRFALGVLYRADPSPGDLSPATA